ncbi:MAG: hypothetical protein ABW178_00085 [Pseudoxanthomonas sp.]
MPTPPALPATAEDLQQLRLLSLFHYIVGGITGLFSLFPVIHLVIGLAMVTGQMPAQPDQQGALSPEFFGWFFVAFAGAFIFCGLTLAGFIAYAGRCLARQQRHTLCLVVAGLSCMMMPFGTVLGVFTLIVLLRPQVKALFASTAPTATA